MSDPQPRPLTEGEHVPTCTTVRWEGHILLAVDEVHHWSHDGFQLSS